MGLPNGNDKKLRTIRLILLQANDILADLEYSRMTSESARDATEAKAFSMKARHNIDKILGEDL